MIIKMKRSRQRRLLESRIVKILEHRDGGDYLSLYQIKKSSDLIAILGFSGTGQFITHFRIYAPIKSDYADIPMLRREYADTTIVVGQHIGNVTTDASNTDGFESPKIKFDYNVLFSIRCESMRNYNRFIPVYRKVKK